jgi:hypothetical protein
MCRALGERAGVAEQRADTLAARTLANGEARLATLGPPPESPGPRISRGGDGYAAPTDDEPSSRRRRTPDLARRVSRTGYDASPPRRTRAYA